MLAVSYQSVGGGCVGVGADCTSVGSGCRCVGGGWKGVSKDCTQCWRSHIGVWW